MYCENIYERREMFMGKNEGKKKNKTGKIVEMKAETIPEPAQSTELKFGQQIAIGIISGVVVGVISVGFNVIVDTNVINTKLSRVEEDIKYLRDGMDTLKGDVAGLNGRVSALESSHNDLNSRISRIEGLNDNLTLKGLNNASITFEKDVVKSEIYLAQPTWKQGEVIAVDLKTGKEYTSQELISQKILMFYEENAQEVFFYGQFNENNRWDKDCLINVYEDDSLSLIMEAVYDDGELIKYKQIIPDTTAKGQDVWIVSERTVQGDSNVGVSCNYYREEAVIKSFSEEDVQEKDMILVEDFKESMNSQLEAFYYGATSNGKYNDTSGEAYLAKYSDDGSIRTLYVGQFKDGQFDDQTGDAWYITREDTTGKETDYMYYKGAFKEGKTVKKEVHNNLTIQEIQDYISGYKFDCELKWFFNGDVLQTL